LVWLVGLEPTKAATMSMPRPLTYTMGIAGALPICLQPQ
jgi:hypothetical protein